MLFLSVRGFLDYAGPTVHSRLAWLPCCLPPTRNEVGVLIYGLFAAQSPRPPMPLSTLQETSHDVPCKTRGQDGFATSFPVGLLHPLQHAGLSRRTPSCPSRHNRRQEVGLLEILKTRARSFSYHLCRYVLAACYASRIRSEDGGKRRWPSRLFLNFQYVPIDIPRCYAV